MPRHLAPLPFALCALVLFAAALVSVHPAEAHRSGVFAVVNGTMIQGQATLAGEEAPARLEIKIYDPADRLLGTTITDHHGAFTFQPTERTDHLVVLDTADGHRATFTVPAAQIILPSQTTGPTMPKEELPHRTPPPLTDAPPDLESMVRQAVTDQITPLRQDIHQLGERMRLQDILGGIGYIAGLAGLLVFLRSRNVS